MIKLTEENKEYYKVHVTVLQALFDRLNKTGDVDTLDALQKASENFTIWISSLRNK